MTKAHTSPSNLLAFATMNLHEEESLDQKNRMHEATLSVFRTPPMVKRKRKLSTVTPPRPLLISNGDQQRRILGPQGCQHAPPMMPSDLDSFFSMRGNPFRSLANRRMTHDLAPLIPPEAARVVLPMPTLEDLESPQSSRRVLKMRRLTTAEVIAKSLRLTEENYIAPEDASNSFVQGF